MFSLHFLAFYDAKAKYTCDCSPLPAILDGVAHTKIIN